MKTVARHQIFHFVFFLSSSTYLLPKVLQCSFLMELHSFIWLMCFINFVTKQLCIINRRLICENKQKRP